MDINNENKNLPEVLEGSKSKNALDSLAQSNNDDILNFKKEISMIEVNQQEVINFIGKENKDLLVAGEKILLFSKIFDIDKEETLNIATSLLEKNQTTSEVDIAKMLLIYFSQKDNWIGELAKEMLKENWGGSNG